MSILTKIKSTAKKVAGKAANGVANGIAKASKLSPKQIEEIEKKREEYLAQKPNMNGKEAQELIEKSMGAIWVEVFQAYLPQLSEIYSPVDISSSELKFNTQDRIRYFDVTKWVTDKEENSIDKLVNVYQTLSGSECNVALIYHKNAKSCRVIMAISNQVSAEASESNSFCNRLKYAVKGNFPGSIINDMQADVPSVINDYDKNDYRIATVSNMAAEKSEKFISQSIEKLFDGIVLNEKQEYTIILLALPIAEQIEERKARLYEIYTALAPFSSWQANYTYIASDTIGSQAGGGVHAGLGAGNQKTQTSGGSSTTTVSMGEFESKTNGGNVSFNLGETILGKIPFVGGLFKGVSGGISHSATTGINTARSLAKTLQNSVSNGMSMGFNFGLNFSRSSSQNATRGVNDGITNTYVNYGVKNTLKIIEEQMKRLEQSSALGMWDFAAYIVSNDDFIAENVANMYLSLTQGEKSFMTTAAVNLWSEDESKVIMQSIKRLQHPMFGMAETDEDWHMYPSLVNAATVVSGRELAYSMNFPRKSVSGMPVLESVSFGREIHRYQADEEKKSITIGKIYHMRNSENTNVSLDVDSLASHTFVTGSTGAGKSNAIYQIVDKLKAKNKKFLIIEPAKGEYKSVFGGVKGINVYGTNPKKAQLLKINPFSFVDDIHVLEHIDRLVEIFNACWPMYAAMPAVLKDAIERIYIDKGWDLNYSSCEPKVFPTLYDLLKVLPQVMEESQYSSDTKSDYSGALITRVKSLTNGINGQIFCTTENAEQASKKLFEKNVIVDISRVGSTETKSLIMGMLIMKLQEYHMSKGDINSDLQHITDLEEAHNLLRRTSSVQSQESSNLQGKSVEMISNAIAEMRTYGEGFIIADQAPELLDESVIRNTNTKIIFRLPDEKDRILAGRSEALTNNQVSELAKLPRGVAAVYQNDWVEAVLCAFEKFDKNYGEYEYEPKDESEYLKKYFYKLFGIRDGEELSKENVDFIREWINVLNVSEYTKSLLEQVLDGKELNKGQRSEIAYNVFKGQQLGYILQNNSDEEKGVDDMRKSIYNMFNIQDELLTNVVKILNLNTILDELEHTELANRYAEFAEGGIIV